MLRIVRQGYPDPQASLQESKERNMIRATGEETKQERETLPKAKETTDTQATQDSVEIATKYHTTGRPLAPKHQHQKIKKG